MYLYYKSTVSAHGRALDAIIPRQRGQGVPLGEWRAEKHGQGVPQISMKNKKVHSSNYLTSLFFNGILTIQEVLYHMNSKEIVKTIMEQKSVTNADMAAVLEITQAALWDRLKTEKTVKKTGQRVKTLNITVGKLNDMLRYLGYELVVMPRAKAGKIDNAYVITDTDSGTPVEE